jgi:uncharacterized protein YbcC (UPF0753/DUF2309 family)
MNSKSLGFNEAHVLHELKHYLPAQAPLKDFIHHNTLHAFQHEPIKLAIRKAFKTFGYNTTLSLAAYRNLYASGNIAEATLRKGIANQKGENEIENWMKKVIHTDYPSPGLPRIGALRAFWKKQYQLDMDSLVHPTLFRVLCSYLDQGIAMWNFPVWQKGFLESIKEIELNSFTSFFRTKQARQIFLQPQVEISELLSLLVGDEELFEQYLFDQQFAHQGWSGMVASIETLPESLLDRREISLKELITFELLLELDALYDHFGNNWKPLSKGIIEKPIALFAPSTLSEEDEVLLIWQEAFEWTYYDQVLQGILQKKKCTPTQHVKSFQAMFCIDDRECSLRRYLEQLDTRCETFGTPGFFGVEFYFQPEHGKFYTKLCPAPVTPKFLIKEIDNDEVRKKDLHFNKQSHSLFRGWLITQTLGFWSAINLFINIFKPSMSPATASSFKHMAKQAKLTIENQHPDDCENGLQIGFTIEQMTDRVEALLKSIGLIENFAQLVYIVGHGSSSINNPHFAAYDCGACSGRPGSVNARVMSYMANHAAVRKRLVERGIIIPAETKFVGALHDTTRDEIQFFDDNSLSVQHKAAHQANELIFQLALSQNAKERSRRFELINTKESAESIHERVKLRSVSLFEPRPELNHATNALCIVGRRQLTRGVFLDRRSFLNSYDYSIDPKGNYLFNILKAAAPVCGGINLEYFFSRVDNQKLGAGTKLPHNVMGLIGVANGIEGDLRPGLPSQMIEVHDPVRLLILVEHLPEVVLDVIQRNDATYEWFKNEWVKLIVMNPVTETFYCFRNKALVLYKPNEMLMPKVQDINTILETHEENLPVYLMD